METLTITVTKLTQRELRELIRPALAGHLNVDTLRFNVADGEYITVASIFILDEPPHSYTVREILEEQNIVDDMYLHYSHVQGLLAGLAWVGLAPKTDYILYAR